MKHASLLMLLGVLPLSAALTNECSLTRGDGTTAPCSVSTVDYGSITFGGIIQPTDVSLEANVGFTQVFTLRGRADGTPAKIAIIALDFYRQDSRSGSDFRSVAKSNIPLNTVLDPGGDPGDPDPSTFRSVTFGTPIALNISIHQTAFSHPEGPQHISGQFKILKINVYDASNHLLGSLEGPSGERPDLRVGPSAVPEPSTLGFTAVGGLAFLATRLQRRRTSRG